MKLLLFLFVVNLTFCSFAQQNKNASNIQELLLQDSVYMLQTSTYIPLENSKLWFQGSDSIVFNKQGNTLYDVSLDGDGRVFTATQYEYSSNGTLNTMKYISPVSQVNWRFLYDSIGNLIEQQIVYKDSVVSKTIYEYNSKNTILLEKRYCINGISDYEMHSEYDSLQFLIRRTEMSNPIACSESKEQLNSKLIEEIENQKSIIEYTFINNEFGNVLQLQVKQLPNGKEISKSNYQYNSLQQMVTVIDYVTDEDVTYTVFKMYDANNNCIKTDEFNSKSKSHIIREYSYKYDSHKNWIRKEEFEDGVLIQVFNRKIWYY